MSMFSCVDLKLVRMFKAKLTFSETGKNLGRSPHFFQ